MFVSSYSTYIDTNSTKRVNQEKESTQKKSSDSFSSKLLQTAQQDIVQGEKLPLSYISNYKALHNRQQLQEKLDAQNPQQMKFTKINSMNSAKVAYADNSKMFPRIQKPKQTIDQTPKISATLPSEAQASQESIMKVAMVNTYISNENYYHITAA